MTITIGRGPLRLGGGMVIGQQGVQLAGGGGFSAGLIVFEGDSITEGYGLADPSTESYPAQLASSLGSQWTTHNLGVSNAHVKGNGTNSLEYDAAATDSYLDHATYQRNVLVVFTGTNDMTGGQAAADVYQELVAYCQSRQGMGWQVVVVTCLPRADINGTKRDTFNSSIRTNWATFADALADVAADTTIGEDGDQSNTTYYQDGIHPTAAGATIIAGIVQTAIEQLSNDTARPSSYLLDRVYDVVSAYGFNLLRSNYTGDALTVRRSSDDTTQDIGFATGEFDEDAFTAFVGGGSGYAANLRDQMQYEGHNLAQDTSSLQPQIILDALNGHPVLRFTGTEWLRSSAFAELSQPWTWIHVSKQDDATNRVPVSNGTTSGADPGFWYDGAASFSAGTVLTKAGVDVTQWHIYAVIANGASSKIWVDGGAGTTGAAGSRPLSRLQWSGWANSYYFDGDIAAHIALRGAVSLDDLNTICGALATRFGLTWATAT